MKGNPWGLWKEIPGEQLCIGHRGGQFRSGSVTRDAHHQLTYCWCSVNLTWRLPGEPGQDSSLYLAVLLMCWWSSLSCWLDRQKCFLCPTPRTRVNLETENTGSPLPNQISDGCPVSASLPAVPCCQMSPLWSSMQFFYYSYMIMLTDFPRKGSSQLSGTMARRCI